MRITTRKSCQTQPFLAAAKTGNQDVINEFLNNGFPVDICHAQGYTALIMAAYYGQQQTVSTLLNMVQIVANVTIKAILL